ncbi:two-component system regulatory protein YycI [Peptoniphilus stercorisuis]|uniref:Regulatory protein YycI of two-component signal transduction system YycFG n=1 Tax=Peptoniphilus stercorisuis TaxID=1436965 RepID=A0ABS4K9U9_9FIRM|nr:two-component system regulatory protein YycI [Peptoniphilus stercorisuis]MBP2024550.1 regulatory protein YycI of two-component signal transduction system YycFG [Peptoniphilus stercorisuis]
MDWAKAKSILIVALLITNITLFGFNFYNHNLTKDSSRSKNFANETIELLAEKGIKVNSYIPRSENKLPTLRVEFENYNPDELNSKFFESLGNVENPSTDFSKVNYATKLITIMNNRRMRYEDSSMTEEYNLTKISEAQDIATDFLLEHGFDTRDMEITHTEKSDNQYIINFSKIHDGIVLERSYTNFVIDNRGVISMDRLWLNVTDISQSEVHLMPAAKALLTLLDDNDYYNKTVKNIDECYYFDPEEQGYVEDITKAERGRAIPAWRIQFTDGENIEIDNY